MPPQDDEKRGEKYSRKHVGVSICAERDSWDCNDRKQGGRDALFRQKRNSNGSRAGRGVQPRKSGKSTQGIQDVQEEL
jgi:hypothetical protein